MFRVTVALDDERLAVFRKAPDLCMKALQAGADHWHTKILPRHFNSEAHGKYDYAQRSRDYLKSKHGVPDLVSSGSLRRDLKSTASFVEGGSVMELRMHARVLNFAPAMPENSFDRYVTQRKAGRGVGYPNMKREIKAITDDEREAVAQVVAGVLDAYMNASGSAISGGREYLGGSGLASMLEKRPGAFDNWSFNNPAFER
jgi:hypothetical protein